jgi:hypothetical protein
LNLAHCHILGRRQKLSWLDRYCRATSHVTIAIEIAAYDNLHRLTDTGHGQALARAQIQIETRRYARVAIQDELRMDGITYLQGG